MSLSTNVAVRFPAGTCVPPRRLLDVAVECLLSVAGRSGDQVLVDEPKRWASHWSLSTTCGQGLPAWVFVQYQPDGPYAARDWLNRDEDPEYYAEPENLKRADKVVTPWCTYLLDFDTTYGYRDDVGNNCDSLHALTIMKLQEWLDALGGTLMWENEYAGTWHEFEDAKGWKKFATNGRETQDWFVNSAIPAMNRMLPRVALARRSTQR